MKKLWKIFVKLICAFIPHHRWRKIVRDYLLRRSSYEKITYFKNIFLEIKTKQIELLNHADNIETLFIGSSHVAYGFNPAFFSQTAFNLGSTSQDLFTSYHLIKYFKDKCPNLKTVFLGFDVFSRGFDLAQTSASQICSSYKYLYDFDYHPENYTKKYQQLCRIFDNEQPSINDCGGYMNPPKFGFTDAVNDRVASHIKNHNRPVSQLSYIQNILDLLDNQNFYLVFMPVRQDYQDACLKQNFTPTIFQNLADVLNIKYFNFWNDNSFNDNDFYDYDHLNPSGAIKFSKKLKELCK